jgi:hypothetical protein
LWKIFYTDGDTFAADQGRPDEAPCKPVALILQCAGRKGWRIMEGTDWYRWYEDANRWAEAKEFDILYELATKGYVMARRGGYMAEDDYLAMREQVYNEMLEHGR